MAYIDFIYKSHGSALDVILGSAIVGADQDEWNLIAFSVQLLHRLHAGKPWHGYIANDYVRQQGHRDVHKLPSISDGSDDLAFDRKQMRHCPTALFMVIGDQHP